MGRYSDTSAVRCGGWHGGVVQQRGGGGHGAGHIAVVRVEQGPAHGEALDAGQREGGLPAGEDFVLAAVRIPAEQHGGHGGGRHDAFHLGHHGQLHPGVGAGGAEAFGDGDGLDHGVGGEVVADLAVLADGEERLHHGDELALGEGIDGLGGGFQGGDGVRVAEADAGEHLAAVGTQRLEGGSGVAGEAVIEFVDQAGEAAAVHRAEEQLAFERAQQEQVVHDVRGGQDAVHVRVGQGDLQPVQELPAVGHRHGVAADGQGAAGRVVGGDDEVLLCRTSRRGGGGGPSRRGRSRPGSSSRMMLRCS